MSKNPECYAEPWSWQPVRCQCSPPRALARVWFGWALRGRFLTSRLRRGVGRPRCQVGRGARTGEGGLRGSGAVVARSIGQTITIDLLIMTIDNRCTVP